MEVRLTPEAVQQEAQLPKRIRVRVYELVRRLESWPTVSGAKPLKHELKGAFRVRTGDYRLLFRVRGDVVVVFRIDNRRDVYKE